MAIRWPITSTASDRPLVGICPPGDLVEVVADARQLPRALALHSRRAARSMCAPGRATGAPDPTASSLRSAPWRATRHAPRRWRGPSPKRRVRRSRRAVSVVGVRGGTAPRQPLRGTRGVWPRRVGCSPPLAASDKHVRRSRRRSGPPRRNCSARASMNRAHRARANTPRGRQTIVIHSARRPVQPNPESACSRLCGWMMAPLAAGLNSCSSILMPRTVRSRLQGKSTRGKRPIVSGRVRTCQKVSEVIGCRRQRLAERPPWSLLQQGSWRCRPACADRPNWPRVRLPPVGEIACGR